MKEEIEILAQLQEADIKIKQMLDQLTKGPERIEFVENQLKDTEEKLKVDEDLKKEIQKKQRVYERETQDNNIRINKDHEKARSIKTNKEYQAILTEIDEIKKRNSQIEDEIINCLMELDEIDVNLKKTKGELKKLRLSVKEEKKKVNAELDLVKVEYDELLTKRMEFEKKAKPNLLKRYTLLLKSCNGIAVCGVQNGTCVGCNTSIRPQLVIELQKSGEFTYCPSCQRMIYWKASDKPKE